MIRTLREREEIGQTWRHPTLKFGLVRLNRFEGYSERWGSSGNRFGTIDIHRDMLKVARCLTPADVPENDEFEGPAGNLWLGCLLKSSEYGRAPLPLSPTGILFSPMLQIAPLAEGEVDVS